MDNNMLTQQEFVETVTDVKQLFSSLENNNVGDDREKQIPIIQELFEYFLQDKGLRFLKIRNHFKMREVILNKIREFSHQLHQEGAVFVYNNAEQYQRFGQVMTSLKQEITLIDMELAEEDRVNRENQLNLEVLNANHGPDIEVDDEEEEHDDEEEEEEEWLYMPQRSESDIQRELEEEQRYMYGPEDDGEDIDDWEKYDK
jgi:hypothetical protein